MNYYNDDKLPVGAVAEREEDKRWICGECSNICREWPRDGRCPAYDAQAVRCEGLVRLVTDHERFQAPE